MSDGVAALLPPNSTPLERAVDQSTGTRVEALDFSPMRGLWNPWTCPTGLLPWLAWACSVDDWDDDWPEATRRRVIADSYAVHSVKGTVGAVKRALASLGYDTRLIEWTDDDPQGTPYTFRLEVDVAGKPVTDATYTEIERTALTAKNVRSHLTGIRAVGQVGGVGYIGGACIGGEDTTVYPWTAPDTLATGQVFVGGAVATLDQTIIYPGGA